MKLKLWIALIIGAMAGVIFFAHAKTNVYLLDPDRYYHFALSREMVDSGSLFLREVRQVADLGWNEYFPDKEFFFHQITALGYRIAGDQGVIYSVLSFFVLTLSAFFIYATRRLPILPSALVTVATFTLPIFFYRMLSVRPHVTAVLFFVLLNIGILRRRRWEIALAAFLFVLTYHAFYIALICLGALAVVSLLQKGEERRSGLINSAIGIGAVVVGLLVNPYFPSNIVSALEISKIPFLMRGELSSASFGSELYPLNSVEFLQLLIWPMAIVFLGLTFFGAVISKWWRGLTLDWRWLYLSPLTLFFLLLCFQSRRASEYLVPMTGFLLLLALEEVKRWSWKEYSASLVAFSIFVALNVKDHRIAGFSNSKTWYPEIRDAVLAIPDLPGGKIYNCEWDTTPSLYYHRPEFRFIDIMDPSLLYFHRKDIFQSRESLRLGKVGDAHNLISKAFGADYALCMHPEIRTQLDGEPGLRRIHPIIGDPALSAPIVYTVYEIRKERIEQFVRSFVVRVFPQATKEGFQSLTPADAATEEKEEELENTSFMNLLMIAPGFKSHGEKAPEAFCALVRPTVKEMERIQGAKYLALGGGRNLRFWLNDRLIYESGVGFARAQATQVVVPLAKPLQASDQLKIVACSSSDAPFWGVAVSAWKRQELEELCRWKRSGATGVSSKADFSGKEAFTCLGPIAAPAVPQSLRAP